MNAIQEYFTTEKQESLLFIMVGTIAIGIGIYFLLKIKQPYFNGMAYSFMAIALIQLTVGISVYGRSPKDIERVTEIVQTDSTRIQTEEMPRMKTVMKNFVIYRWVEIALLLLGVILFFMAPAQTLWKGVGLGLAIQAGLMLLLDYFAEKRGAEYLKYLFRLVNERV